MSGLSTSSQSATFTASASRSSQIPSNAIEFSERSILISATGTLSNPSATRLSVYPSTYNIATVNQTLVHPTFTVNQTHFLSNSPTASLNVSATALQNIATTGLVQTPSINPSNASDSLLESSVSQGKNCSWPFEEKNPRWQFTTGKQMMRIKNILNYSFLSSRSFTIKKNVRQLMSEVPLKLEIKNPVNAYRNIL